MPSTYQLVPYLMQVAVRQKPAETRAVDDIDGGGRRLGAVLVRILDAMRSRELVDAGDANRKLRVTSLKTGSLALFAVVEPGRSGIRSSIEQASGVVTRTERDTEYVPLRYAFFFPPRSHSALILAERAGITGAMTMTGKALTRTFNTYVGDLRLTIAPAVTGEVMRKMTENRPVNALVFTRPNPRDVDGRVMHIAGESVTMEVRFAPPRRRHWGWDALPKEAGVVTRDSLLGILAPHIANDAARQSVDHLRDDGWQVATEVQLPNGARRTVNVEFQTATTMSFPIIEPGATGEFERPSEAQFQAACVATLNRFEGQHGLRQGVPGQCRWLDEEWSRPDGEVEWRVDWDELGQSAADLA